MSSRRRKLMLNVSTNIGHAGSVMPHAAVGILKKRRKKGELLMYVKGGSKTDPVTQDNPFPYEARY
jgi:hypothetical protein